MAFEADTEHYRFLVRNEARWDPVVSDDLLRNALQRRPGAAVDRSAGAGTGSPMRITFGREPVDKPSC